MKRTKVLVVDAQGGGIGRQVVLAVKQKLPQAEVTAVGTNGIAASAMLKAGADHAATGENAVVVACRDADVIVGPIGIVIADALCGEITPTMALAIARSRATRILIPMSHCSNVVAGLPEGNIGQLVLSAVTEIEKITG